MQRKIIFSFFYNFFNIFKCLFLRDWERERAWTGGREESGEQRIWSGFWAASREPDVGFKLTNHEIMAWTEVRCLTNWATQTPLFYNSYACKYHPFQNCTIFLIVFPLSKIWLQEKIVFQVLTTQILLPASFCTPDWHLSVGNLLP